MKKKFIFLTLIVAVVLMVLNMASFADARSRGNFTSKPGTPYYQHGPGQHMVEQFKAHPYKSDDFRGIMHLDLSSEQITQIRQMILDFQKETLDLRNQIQAKQLEMRELRLADELDMDQVRAKLEEIAEIQVELRMKALERQEKIKELLTPEQLEKFGLGFQMQRFGYGTERFDSREGFKGSRR